MANTPDNFSEKVLAKLKEKNMAVDLTDEPIDNQPQVEAQSEAIQPSSEQGFTAFAASGTAPTSGGNKDILIIPGFGGTTASAASQINFYWIEPATVPTDNTTDATGTTRRSTLFNYSDDLNNPVLAFGGYNGTVNLAPAGTYGGSTTNSVAKIWIHPFTGTIDTDYMNFGTNTVTASTSAGILSWVPGSTRLSVGDGTNAKQIAYTTDVTSANQITASANNTDTTLYPLFISDVGDGTTNRIVYTGDATYSPVLNGTNGNLTITGDLAVNGLDITTGSGTASVFNANATTLNMGQAATSISIGASTGTFTVGNTTVTFTNATSFTGTASAITFLGASTSVAAFGGAATLGLGSSTGTLTIGNPTIATGTSNLTLFNTGATTVNAFGAATTLTMGATSGTGTIRNATIDFPNATTISGSTGLATVFSSANPSSLAVFGSATTATIFGSASSLTMGATSGTGTIRNATIDFPNATTISGSSGLATVFSSANPSSLAVFGAATTATIYGSATSLTIGGTSGTGTIRNATISFPNATTISGSTGLATVFASANPSSLAVFGAATTATIFGAAATLGVGSSTGTLTIGNPTIATGTSNLTLFNTGATTVNAFGAATTLTMGATSGTGTIRNATIDFPNATTINGSTGLATVFSSANPSSLAVFGAATTATIYGSATSLTIGGTSGTGTIRNATISFPNATIISGSTGLATVFASANPSSLAVFGAATTATIFGAAATLGLGSSTGTLTIGNPTIATGTSSLTLFNTGATTVNAFGAATSLTMGATTGTGTIRNATIDFPNATTISGSASLATVFSSANPSSLAVFGSATTATIFGSGTALTMGAATGTATIRNTTVTFTNATNFTGTTGTVAFLAEPSTVTAFGGATGLTLGAATGTSTIRNTTVTFTNATNFTGTTGTVAFLAEPTTVTAFAGATTGTMFGTTATSTINFGAGTLGSGNTRTINIGNNAVATSTTVIYIGASLNTSNSTISFNGNRIQGVGEPTQATDAATKYYVDSFSQGLDLHESVKATSGLTAIGTSVLYFQQNAPSATLGAALGTSYIESTNNEALSTTYFDSQSLIVGDRVLVATGASTTTYNINGVTTAPTGGTNVMNGIYTVTSTGGAGSKWRLDRATDTNDNNELEGGTFAFVQTGSTYADSAWVCTNDTHTTAISIGSDAISFTQFSGAGQITAGNGLTKSGNTINAVGTADRISVTADAIDIASTYVGQSTITTLGTITTGTWTASTIALARGGTGTTAYASNNGLVYYDNGNTRLSTLTTGANTTVLIGAGAGSLPTYGQVNLGTMVTGTLPLANGGLGTTTFTQYGVLYGNLGTSVLVTAAGTNGQLFLGATSGAPQWGTMSGDATIGNTGVITIANTAVTFAKMQNSASAGLSVIGRSTNSAGSFAEIAATVDGSVLRLNGTTLGFGSVSLTSAVSGILPIANGGTATSSFATTNGFVYYDGSKLVTSGAATSGQLLLSGTTGTAAAWATLSGDVTINGSGTTAIGANKVTNAMLRQSAGFSVIGKTDTGTGNVADITASSTDTVLRYNGTNVSFGAINLSSTNAVTGTLAVGAGGTGTSSYNFGGVVYAGSTAATGLLSVAPAAANKHLVSTGTGTGNYPVWSTATMATTYTAGTILYASATDTVGGLATTATAALVSNGSGTPSWTSGATANRVLRTDGSAITFSQVALGTDVSGTLAATNGGTGQNSAFTANALVYASSTAALATGSLLTWIPGTTSGTGSTAALYVNPSSLTSGTAVNINIPSGGSTGKIIVGQLNGTDKFSVDANGNLRATTKSFDIEHPTKPGMRLVYGVLEGPEHGVYHRGTVEGKGKLVVELPEYWHKLVGENYTVQLTPWGNYAVHIVEKTENYFIIELSSNILMKKFKSIKVDYIIHGSRLDAPLEIEQ